MTIQVASKRLSVTILNPDGTPTGKTKQMVPSNTLFRMRRERPRVHWDGVVYELQPIGDAWSLRLRVRPGEQNPNNTKQEDVHGDVE